MTFLKATILTSLLTFFGSVLTACSVAPSESSEPVAGSASEGPTETLPLADCRELLHFRLVGLKDLYRVDLCVGERESVSGGFHVFAEYSEIPTTTAFFSGRLEERELEVQFASGDSPYPRSPDAAVQGVVRWQLDDDPAASTKLVFETYGRDHERNHWGSYLAEMERAHLVEGASLERITVDDLEAPP